MKSKKFSLKWIINGIGLGVGAFLAITLIFWVMVYFTKGVMVASLLSFTPKKQMHGINILVVGVDETRVIQRSDSIMVLHLDDIRNRIGVLSVPRDTRANIPGVGISKINHAYAHGGIKLLRDSISSLLNIPIDFYVKVNLSGVDTIVDQIGGIPVYVERDMVYNDNAANLHINIPKGKQVLTGSKVREYLRFRHDKEGDIGRIRRQQTFIKALLTKINQSRSAFTSVSFIKQLSKSMSTDLSIGEIMGFVSQFNAAFRNNNVHAGAIPGSVTLIGGVSYWRPDIVEMDRMVEDVLFGFDLYQLPDQDLVAKKAAKQTLVQSASVNQTQLDTYKKSTIKSPPKTSDRRKVTHREISRLSEQVDLNHSETKKLVKQALSIEVLNGNGFSGSATEVASILKQRGFKVVRFDNSGKFDYQKTIIVDWKGNLQNVLVLANVLQVQPEDIVVYNRPSKSLDVTVVLGKDWRTVLSNISGQ